MDNLFSQPVDTSEVVYSDDTGPVQNPVFSDAERTNAPSHKPKS